MCPVEILVCFMFWFGPHQSEQQCEEVGLKENSFKLCLLMMLYVKGLPSVQMVKQLKQLLSVRVVKCFLCINTN